MIRPTVEHRSKVLVANSQGLHARPCHAVVSTALRYQSELRIGFDGRLVNGKSILELMTLNAACGSELELCAKGGDAEALLADICALFRDGFGERETG